MVKCNYKMDLSKEPKLKLGLNNSIFTLPNKIETTVLKVGCTCLDFFIHKILINYIFFSLSFY